MPKKKEDVLDELDSEFEEEEDSPDNPVDVPIGPSDETFEEAPNDEVSSEAVRMTADVPIQVVAVLGKKTISMKELLDLRIGQVLDLNRPPNEVVDLVAGGKLVAKGELVDIDGKMGVRVVKMVR